MYLSFVISSGETIPSNLVDDGQGTIWLNNVDCSGSENKLINCTYSNGTSHCRHWHDVGIDCFSCATEDEGRVLFKTNVRSNLFIINPAFKYAYEKTVQCRGGMVYFSAVPVTIKSHQTISTVDLFRVYQCSCMSVDI